jgi:N-methylhydantoinase A/oxoprolinase/acetone carboxylase beta subunit
MVREVRIHSVRRGYDPRECALVAFGGAGPLHACEVAAQLEVPVILVPPAPGITSAMGLLATDLKYDVVRTVGVMLAEADRAALDRAFGEMEDDLRARFAAGEEPVLRREAACRYTGQGYELAVGCDALGDDWRAVLDAGFHERHRGEYGFAFPGDPVEVINLRVTATAAIPTRPQTSVPAGDGDPQAAVTGEHTVVFGDASGHEAHLVTTYDRDALRAHDAIPGPAIVHEMDSTVVISPGWDGVVLPDGTIRLEAAA